MEIIRIYSNGFLENITIEELTPACRFRRLTGKILMSIVAGILDFLMLRGREVQSLLCLEFDNYSQNICQRLASADVLAFPTQ